MAGEMIQAVGNEHILVDVKRCRDSLRKEMGAIVGGVPPVVEIGWARSLPFLSLHDTPGVWRMENEPFKLQFSNASDFGPHLESHISIGFVGVGPLDESHFWIEIWSNLSALELSFHPVRPIGQRSTNIAFSTRVAQRLCSGHVRVHKPVLEEHQSRIDSTGLIEAVQ